jgi:hypothetical protein
MAYRRIENKGNFLFEEYKADVGTIKPGMLLKCTATGVIPNNEIGKDCEALFALEDAFQGKTVSDTYTISNQVQCVLPSKGSVVNALLKSGNTYKLNTPVVSAGDGTLIPLDDAASGIPGCVVGFCVQAAPGTLSANALHPVRIV